MFFALFFVPTAPGRYHVYIKTMAMSVPANDDAAAVIFENSDYSHDYDMHLDRMSDISDEFPPENQR
ncbi:hypothetical protein Y032_0411g960 [Ancylostoma ceylanicum]|uniref:Uncharacterized protein n=1 Tax=Ancylostoma ceylanicum TaxID=53326 RepID=A0A016X2E3_9BILA|nr:hypothetical protein Y032_0411g960 [Ancylostoma ceylanicum]